MMYNLTAELVLWFPFSLWKAEWTTSILRGEVLYVSLQQPGQVQDTVAEILREETCCAQVQEVLLLCFITLLQDSVNIL